MYQLTADPKPYALTDALLALHDAEAAHAQAIANVDRLAFTHGPAWQRAIDDSIATDEAAERALLAYIDVATEAASALDASPLYLSADASPLTWDDVAFYLHREHSAGRYEPTPRAPLPRTARDAHVLAPAAL